MGAASRGGRRSRRPAHLRIAPLDHVLADVLLLLRASEDEVPRGLRLPRPRREWSDLDTPHPAGIEDEDRAHPSHPPPRRGRTASHGVVAGSVRLVGGPEGRSRRDAVESNGRPGHEGSRKGRKEDRVTSGAPFVEALRPGSRSWLCPSGSPSGPIVSVDPVARPRAEPFRPIARDSTSGTP